MARSAKALHAAAVELANRGRFASAKRLLENAASFDVDVDVNLRARIAGTLAFIQARAGALAEAERMCAEALQTPGLDPSTVAILAGQMGSIMEQSGRLDDAERLLSRAIAELDDPIPRANLLVNRMMVGIQLRRLDDAARDAAAAALAYGAHGMHIDEAEARHNLGYIDLLRGDLVSALQGMQSARPILADVAFAAMIDVDRAEVYRDAGLTTEAEAILTRAASAFGVRRMTRNRGEAEYNLARSLLTHDPHRAAHAAGAAARRFRALGNETWAVRADALRHRALLAGGTPLRSGGRVPEPRRTPTLAEVESVADELDRRRFRSEAAALRLSFELWRARHRAGERATTRVRVPRSASMDVRLLAYQVRAERAVAAGLDGEARRHAAAGLDALGEWQRTFGSLDLQTSVVMHGNGLILTGLGAAVRSRRPEVLFEWSERARHLSQQVLPLRPPPNAELAAELAELRMLRADGVNGEWLRDPRAADLHDRARERQWSETGSAAFEQHLTLAELQAALDGATALITYVYSADAVMALVVTRDRASVVDIDEWPAVRRAMPGLRADLDMSATVHSGPLADVVRRSLDDRLAALSAALLDRAAAAAGTRRLVITVPGAMGGIPWAMLPGMRGRVFTLATSATRWANMRGASLSGSTVGFAMGPRVARAEEEVRAAASAWPSAHVLRPDESTVDAVTALASTVDLLHVAAHGRHAVENPLFSGLELADGALFGYDIDRMPRVPAIVVLSACEVGRSSVRWGEEAIGMTRTWLHAGTRAVVAAPVVVADDVACELLAAMHDGLAAGEMPSEALAAAAEKTGIVAPFQAHGSGF
ncbi:MAG TPA: CHAT domain-containing protein [Microbacterium sp.]|nr:CHAT domain-containing protein [Microbacterium sp.]